LLRAEGWTVIRVWEHEIENDLAKCVRRTAATVRRAAATLRRASPARARHHRVQASQRP
jgi:very-short-patch-repair endonuclease